MTRNEPRVDFATIAFPTDELTIKALRKRTPHAFDVPPPANYVYGLRRSYYERSSIDLLLAATIDFERMLAEVVFREELGLPKLQGLPVASGARSELVDSLVNDYRFLGMADGTHTAREMVRDIETQAREQARLHGGRAR